jgi:hypothetical protein
MTHPVQLRRNSLVSPCSKRAGLPRPTEGSSASLSPTVATTSTSPTNSRGPRCLWLRVFHRPSRHLRWRGLETTPWQPDQRRRHGRFRARRTRRARNLRVGGRGGTTEQAHPSYYLSTTRGREPTTALADLNYIFFIKTHGAARLRTASSLITALNTDFDWLREHTRYLQRNRGTRAGDQRTAAVRQRYRRRKAVASAKGAPEPTALSSTSSARAKRRRTRD